MPFQLENTHRVQTPTRPSSCILPKVILHVKNTSLRLPNLVKIS